MRIVDFVQLDFVQGEVSYETVPYCVGLHVQTSPDNLESLLIMCRHTYRKNEENHIQGLHLSCV